MPAQYPTDLAGMYSNPNPFIAKMSQQQFDTAQKTAEQTLADMYQENQQKEQMFPLKMETERALGRQYDATANQSNAMAEQHRDALKVLQSVPMDQRVNAKIAELVKQTSADKFAVINDEMKAGAIYAARALAQGGRISPEDLAEAQSKYPGIAAYLKTPVGVKQLSQVVNAFNAMQPERQQAESVARIHAKGTTDAAAIAAEASKYNNQENIKAGKFAHYSIAFQRNKAKSGTLEQQIGAWTNEAVEYAQAAMETQDPEEQKAFIAKAQQAQAQAQRAQEALIAKQTAATVEANKRAPDLNQMGIPTVTTPSGAPAAATASSPATPQWTVRLVN